MRPLYRNSILHKGSKKNMIIIILYFMNNINISKQKPSCKGCSRSNVAWNVSWCRYVMVGPNEYYIPLINVCNSSRGRSSIPVCSYGIARNSVKCISIHHKLKAEISPRRAEWRPRKYIGSRLGGREHSRKPVIVTANVCRSRIEN